MIENLKILFKRWSGKDPEHVIKLPGSGSSREYYRLTSDTASAIGAYNPEPRENRAFLSFTESLQRAACNVPEVYASDEENHVYILQDLGDETLFERLGALRGGDREIPGEVYEIYRSVVRELCKFQVKGAREADWSVCFPRDIFDRRSMLWDLNYFKYYFLKLAAISYDEGELEEDFHRLTDFLLEAGQEYFMYRDFQSRNVMVVGGEPWFIDYQGGRRGALQYDIASLLYDAKADLPEEVRESLLLEYLASLEEYIPVDRDRFMKHYYGFVLIRILQALGAYGFRGYYENKPHFLRSIPYALANLRVLLEKGVLDFGTPALTGIISTLASHPELAALSKPASDLVVSISSFSYKNGLPADGSGHGGGYVFDCRALPNPGRMEEYRAFTGKDKPVIDYLRKERAVEEFLNHASSLVDQSIRNYIERGFTRLSVAFGCTGGQHRSVYCAEELARFIEAKYKLTIIVNHKELQTQTSSIQHPASSI